MPKKITTPMERAGGPALNGPLRPIRPGKCAAITCSKGSEEQVSLTVLPNSGRHIIKVLFTGPINAWCWDADRALVSLGRRGRTALGDDCAVFLRGSFQPQLGMGD